MAFLDNINSISSFIELGMFIGGIIFFWAKLEAATKSNQQAISVEIKHVKDLMELNHQAIKEDIARLEAKQSESNRVKERLAMQEVIVASLKNTVDSLVRSRVSQDNE